MNSDMQLKVQAYLDNELTPGEARQTAALLTNDPLARDLYHELKQTKEIVRQNEPVVRLEESHDFYWSKIKREIEKVERPAALARQQPWWLRLVAPVAGAVALFAILLSVSGPSTPTPETLATTRLEATVPMHEGEIVAPEMSAITFRSEAEGVTVVWVSSDRAETAPSLLDWFE